MLRRRRCKHGTALFSFSLDEELVDHVNDRTGECVAVVQSIDSDISSGLPFRYDTQFAICCSRLFLFIPG
jgi:hypothetical protein